MTGNICDAIVIGRNEGERLRACLTSVAGRFRRVIYVDSGSVDGSVALAEAMGAEVVMLGATQPFTAARARNTGLARLSADPPEFVQFLDGDCRLDPHWLPSAIDFLRAHPDVAVVCGRRREIAPEASVYSRLADAEWNTPIGEARACGGDALMRYAPLAAVAGYREDLIAGEEPELCVRLRRLGFRIWRLDAEMTLHDIGMTRLSQWWRRMSRSGYAFAEGAALHGAPPERHWVTETRRALLWGLVLPIAAVAGGLFHWSFWLLLALWPLQWLRLSRKLGPERAFFLLLGRFPEAQGVLTYAWQRLRGKKSRLIEYKA